MMSFNASLATRWQRNDSMRASAMAMAVALVFIAGSQFLEIHYGLNIWDEGFLWYGVQRVWEGEVPIRDFMAYDPARYYWVVGISSLWGGRGIIDLRIAVAVFQWLGLVSALWVLASSARFRVFGFLLCAAVLCAWMLPRHKLFDISVSLIMVAVLQWWISCPSIKRHVVAGVFVGVIACFGRNHGVYAAVGSLLSMFAIAAANRGRELWLGAGAWALGIVLGFLPMILASFLVPGFAGAFLASIMFLFEVKATNLPLPVPWPWTIPLPLLSFEDGFRSILIGAAFIGLLVYPVCALVYVVHHRMAGERLDSAVTACLCLSIPYAHYAFSRADVGHLALGIFPALLGTLLFLMRLKAPARTAGMVILVVVSAWIVAAQHPAVLCARSGNCEAVPISGDTLILDPSVSSDVGLIRELSAKYAPDGRAFLATPLWPGAYALMERKSPIWEIYALPARSPAFQRTEIQRLEMASPGFVIVFDLALDNRDELRYSNTHPLIEQYIKEHFIPVKSPNPMYQIYRSMDSKEQSGQ